MGSKKISRRKQRKLQVERLVLARDMAGVLALADQQPNVTGALVGMLSELDDLLRWRAIEALGLLAGHIRRRPEGDGLDVARDLVRRQLWTMTEESGGTAWHAPEAIGEMLYHVQELCEDFATVLFGNGTTEPYEAGVHWAAARLAETPGGRHLLVEVPALVEALGDADPALRGHAARALGLLGDERAREPLGSKIGDSAAYRRYDFDTGEMVDDTVGRTAREALARLE